MGENMNKYCDKCKASSKNSFYCPITGERKDLIPNCKFSQHKENLKKRENEVDGASFQRQLYNEGASAPSRQAPPPVSVQRGVNPNQRQTASEPKSALYRFTSAFVVFTVVFAFVSMIIIASNSDFFAYLGALLICGFFMFSLLTICFIAISVIKKTNKKDGKRLTARLLLPIIIPTFVVLAAMPNRYQPSIPYEKEFYAATAVSAGETHSLAVDTDGYLFSWGNNNYGQLGNGGTIGCDIPRIVTPETKFAVVSAGGNHSLAIDQNGTLYAFGSNEYGQLGSGVTASDYSHYDDTILFRAYSPLPIMTYKMFTNISAGKNHSLAIDSEGRLYAFGSNSGGQLGDGTNNDSFTPIHITHTARFVKVSAGASHSLALDVYGRLYAFGSNEFGQLGDGTTENKNTLTHILTNERFDDISAGTSHSLAIDTSGHLWSWGYGANGQLGDSNYGQNQGDPFYKTTPSIVSKDIKFKSVSAGFRHSLAIDSSYNLFGFGLNASGQIGTIEYGTYTPFQIGLGIKWSKVSAGGEHSIILGDEGVTYACGNNGYGQLGIADYGYIRKLI